MILTLGATNEAARALTPGALYNQITGVNTVLLSVGFPATLATTYAIAQMMLESNQMTSNVSQVDNNYSGITWINKPYQKATKGIAKPSSDGGGNYAHFDTFKDWAVDFLRILSLNTGGQGKPIDATTSQQYLDRLHANHYFTDTAYYTKFNAQLKRVADALTYGAGQDNKYEAQKGNDTITVDAKKGILTAAGDKEFTADMDFTTFKQWAQNNPVKASVGGVFAVVLLIKVFSK